MANGAKRSEAITVAEPSLSELVKTRLAANEEFAIGAGDPLIRRHVEGLPLGRSGRWPFSTLRFLFLFPRCSFFRPSLFRLSSRKLVRRQFRRLAFRRLQRTTKRGD